MTATVTLLTTTAHTPDQFETLGLDERRQQGGTPRVFPLSSSERRYETFLMKATSSDFGVFGSQARRVDEKGASVDTSVIMSPQLAEVCQRLQALTKQQLVQTAEALWRHGGGTSQLETVKEGLQTGRWPSSGDLAEETAAFTFHLMVESQYAEAIRKGLCIEYRWGGSDVQARARALAQLVRAETETAFGEGLAAHLELLVSPLTKDAIRRALGRPELVRSVFDAWVAEYHAAPPIGLRVEAAWFDHAFAHAWLAQGERDARDGKPSHAIYAWEQALDLRRDLTAATARIQTVMRERAAAPWMVMVHDSYAREDHFVAQFPSQAEAEAKVRELNAKGEAHHWAVPTT